MPEDATRDVVAAWVDAQPEDLQATRVSPTGWDLMLAGDHKRTIPVHLELGEHTLTLQSFFMRAPDENAEELYEYLLRRNLRTYALRFALHPDGDVLLVGVLPHTAVTHEELDRLVGQLLTAADEAFVHALRTGFASYIEREQEWRARSGLPRNPIS
ncbi:YbjN domain-containing protein [Egibacter rhizosphaerae]|uniref:YbjN domain-containing protein n=1 Tax=Egibacter rhizosphaerae TaxID=1670831 RepID=A0A411YGE8_9ACTN|nr:YbjN domain-containing protein [Egibacter rhizosphaerae]QBI20256.1 YbjN domain-containing protein [Egibacter rhizosphaerae]